MMLMPVFFSVAPRSRNRPHVAVRTAGAAGAADGARRCRHHGPTAAAAAAAAAASPDDLRVRVLEEVLPARRLPAVEDAPCRVEDIRLRFFWNFV